MLRFTATNAVISRGFDNKSAVKFSEDGSVVRFRIGERVYDKNAENNARWVNINIKAFGNVAERILSSPGRRSRRPWRGRRRSRRTADH